MLVFSKGPVILRPQFEVGETYDDNVLFLPSGVGVGDAITTLGTGLELQLGRGELFRMDLSYRLEYLAYADHSELNAMNHYLANSIQFQKNRLTITGRDDIQFRSDVLGGTTSIRRPVDRTIFYDDYTFQYRVGAKSHVYLGGEYQQTDFDEQTTFYDSTSFRGTAGFGYQATTRLAVSGEVYYDRAEISPNLPRPSGPPLTSIGGFLVGRGQFSSKLTGVLKAGYEAREFEGVSGTPSDPVFDFTLNYRLRPRTSMALSYRRRTGVSVQRATQSYSGDSVRFGVDQEFGIQRKWSGNLYVTYSGYDYVDESGAADRTDRRLSIDLGAGYRFNEWMQMTAAYGFEQFESDTQGIIDYTANRVTLRLHVGY